MELLLLFLKKMKANRNHLYDRNGGLTQRTIMIKEIQSDSILAFCFLKIETTA